MKKKKKCSLPGIGNNNRNKKYHGRRITRHRGESKSRRHLSITASNRGHAHRFFSSHRGSSRMSIGSGESSSWFWENYNIAMDWQNEHFVSFWKSRCVSLEAENRHLYACLKSLQTRVTQGGGEASDEPSLVGDQQRPVDVSEPMREEREYDAEDHEDYVEQEDEEFVFEVDDEMLAFMEKSAKHKLELQKQREIEEKREMEESAEGEKLLRFPQESIQERRDEMARLYGPASSMILSMETAMQLSFDRFSDKHQPKLWPNIPLNL